MRKVKILTIFLFFIVFVILATATDYKPTTSDGCFSNDGCNYTIMVGGSPALNGTNATIGNLTENKVEGALTNAYGWDDCSGATSCLNGSRYGYIDHLTTGNNSQASLQVVSSGSFDIKLSSDIENIDYMVTWDYYYFYGGDTTLTNDFGFMHDNSLTRAVSVIHWNAGSNGAIQVNHNATRNTTTFFPTAKTWTQITVEYNPGNSISLWINGNTTPALNITDVGDDRVPRDLGTLFISSANHGNNTISEFALWNGSVSQRPSTAAAGVSVDPPIFLFPTPGNGQTNATLPVINTSCGANTNYLWLDNLAIPENLRLENQTLGNWTPASLITGTTYFYTAGCMNSSIPTGLFSANTSIRSFIYDSTPPEIDTSLDLNSTLVYDNLTWNLNVSDNLYIAGYNLSLDGVFHNETLVNKSFSIYNYSWDTANNFTGNHTISIMACDAHTDNEISFSAAKDSKDKALTYGTESSVTIRPNAKEKFSSFDTKRLSDRWDFQFTPSSSDGSYTFVVETNGDPIQIFRDSPYQGHLVIFNQGKWIDFESQDKLIKVTNIERISSTKVEVTVSNPNNRKMTFSSIGGLTCIKKDVLYYKLGEKHTYNKNVIEDNQEDIKLTINLTGTPYSTSDLTVVLHYNNTKFSPTRTGTKVIDLEASIITPNTTISTTPVIFKWEYNISTFKFNSSNQTQTVGGLLLIECGGEYNTHTLNISIWNISAPTTGVIVDSLDHTYQVYDTGGVAYRSFNFTNTSVSNFTLCIHPNATITTDFQIEYVYSDISYSYFGYQINLTNITKTLDLYVSDGTSQIIYNVVDNYEDNVENAYINVERFDVGTNSYTTVELLRTDADGNAIGRAVLYTEWYRFTISYNGEVKLIEGALKLTSATKSFKIDLFAEDWTDNWNSLHGVNTALGWNNATNRFHLNYTDSQLSLDEICLKVVNGSMSGDTTLYEFCKTSPGSSGQLLSNPINGALSNQVFRGTAWMTIGGDYFYIGALEINFQTAVQFFKDSGGMDIFMTFILVLAMFLLGAWHPGMSIILGLVGFGAARILGIYIMTLPMFISFLIFGIIVVWRMNNAR